MISKRSETFCYIFNFRKCCNLFATKVVIVYKSLYRRPLKFLWKFESKTYSNWFRTSNCSYFQDSSYFLRISSVNAKTYRKQIWPSVWTRHWRQECRCLQWPYWAFRHYTQDRGKRSTQFDNVGNFEIYYSFV